jgi:hypothetical protein
MNKTAPDHYRQTSIDTCTVADAWDLSRWLTMSLKYIQRAGKKSQESKLDDIQKAVWYLVYDVTKDHTAADDVLKVFLERSNGLFK